jgi:hypothetical protein
MTSSVWEYSYISTIATTLTAIIGAIAIWWQLKGEKDLKEAEFIMNYNTAFIANPELTEIEKELEGYRKTKVFKFEESKRQAIINYLVYHEALAAMIFRGVLNIKNIDDLFMYRFFSRGDKPVIQVKRIMPRTQYYKGCFKLYRHWSAYRKKKACPSLMEEVVTRPTKLYNEYAK